jgi:hypothetical protein
VVPVSRCVRDRGTVAGASKIIYRGPPTSTKLLRVSSWVRSHSFYLIYCYNYKTLYNSGGRWIRTIGPPSEGQRFSRLLFPNTRARHRRLRKRSPLRPAAASSSSRSRSDERRTHSPTRRSSGPPDRRRHQPFALITRCASPCPLHLLLLRCRAF